MAHSYLCAIRIVVVNPPEEGITFEKYLAYKEEDRAAWASVNHRVGWSLPIVKKTDINGIPVMLFKQNRGEFRFGLVENSSCSSSSILPKVLMLRTVSLIRSGLKLDLIKVKNARQLKQQSKH